MPTCVEPLEVRALVLGLEFSLVTICLHFLLAALFHHFM